MAKEGKEERRKEKEGEKETQKPRKRWSLRRIEDGANANNANEIAFPRSLFSALLPPSLSLGPATSRGAWTDSDGR